MFRSIIHFVLFLVNIIFALCVLLSFLAGVVSPEKTVVPAYLALILPISILVNLLFLVFWIIVRRRYFLLPLFLLLVSFMAIQQIFPLHCTSQSKESKEDSFSILSYNTHLFDFHKKHTVESPNNIIKYILERDLDVVCLQEFEVLKDERFLTHEDVLKAFERYPYKHIYYKADNKRFRSGIATFSKFPILNRQFIPIPSDYNSAIYTDILVEGDTIRIINCHLESNKLTEKDKSPQIRKLMDSDHISIFAGKVSQKLTLAYRKRAVQAEKLAEIREKSPHKTIICGDLNDTPLSYVYTKVKGDAVDVFSKLGCGYGASFGDRLYQFRIDYILCDKRLSPASFSVEKVKYSDHYPLSCFFIKQ